MAGEDDAIAGDGLAPAVALDLDGFHLVEAADGDDLRARQHGHAEDMARDPVAGTAGGDALALLQHGRDLYAAVTPGQESRERHQLGTDHHGARERPGVLEVDELLKGACGHDAPGPGARDQARAARRLAEPGRQQHGPTGNEGGPAFGMGDMDAAAG